MNWSTYGQSRRIWDSADAELHGGGKLKGLMGLNWLRLNIGWQCPCHYSGVKSFPNCRSESRLKKVYKPPESHQTGHYQNQPSSPYRLSSTNQFIKTSFSLPKCASPTFFLPLWHLLLLPLLPPPARPATAPSVHDGGIVLTDGNGVEYETIPIRGHMD